MIEPTNYETDYRHHYVKVKQTVKKIDRNIRYSLHKNIHHHQD